MGDLRNPYKTDPQTLRHRLRNLGVDILKTVTIKIYFKYSVIMWLDWTDWLMTGFCVGLLCPHPRVL